MLRIHCLQLWWNLSDPAMEEELHERPLYRHFVGLGGAPRLPDETTILRFRHLLEKHALAPRIFSVINAGLAAQGLMLRTGTLVDATLIAAPSSTKNSTGQRDPEMHQTKKGNQCHFGVKAHIDVDADSGLVHTCRQCERRDPGGRAAARRSGRRVAIKARKWILQQLPQPAMG